jgi:acid stress-induced BolA-like protein IbaG/YrbA
MFNNWGVSYSKIAFLEEALRGHSKVERFDRTQDIYFHIERVGQLPPVHAVLLDEYTLGLAAVLKALQEFRDANCIVNAANWNGYSEEAKTYGETHGIGVFVIGEFLGALSRRDPWKYVKKGRNGEPIRYNKNS